MTRIIKFRGKDYKTGEWAYGLLVPGSPFSNRLITESAGITYMSDKTLCMTTTYINPATVGQFTGLFDRNDKEVYEGDIFEITAHPEIYERDLDGEKCTIHPGVKVKFAVVFSERDACFAAEIIDVDPKGVFVGRIYERRTEIRVGDLYPLGDYFYVDDSAEIVGNIHEEAHYVHK